MLALFQKFIFKKFILLVSDNGARLSLVEKGIEKKVLLVKTITDNEIKQFSKLLAQHSNVPLYILTDVSEQSFKKVTFPSTNRMIIKKLITKRISRDYKKQDLHNFYNIKNKQDKDNKSSNFIIANIANVSPLNDWIDYTHNISNPVDAVFSIPIELSALIDEVHNKLKIEGVAVSKVRWKILVIQLDMGGIRIIVNENSKLIFSRLLSFNNDSTDENDLETLRSQILGTIEYLRRIGFKDKHGLNVFLLFGDALAAKFDASTIKGYKFFYLKRKSLASLISKTATKTNKNFSIDEFVTVYFAKKGKFLGFLTKNLEKISIINNVNIALTILSAATLLFLILFLALKIQSIGVTKNTIERLNFKEKKLTQKLENIREEKFGFDIDEDKVIDVAKLHSMLGEINIKPLDMIFKFSTVLPDILKMKNYSWKLSKGKKIIVKIDAVFTGKDLSYEELFSKYDIFIRDIKTEFSSYEIQHSELPDTINFGNTVDDIPITLNIIGPLR
ncbi:MAG: hypothetical protein HON42_05505 [Alphaproteobacteria bacterium]|jgi:hypothetical protein|nr:hypothetical protein [Alphaproteobacteria bacterium]MBT5828431.1 hypothetical protein [Alphaproteobacteria bacterium]